MIGVVGSDTDAVTAALGAKGATPRTGSPAHVLDGDPDAIVAVGRHAVTDLIADRPVPDVPILALNAGEGFPKTGDAAAAVSELCSGRYATLPHPVLGVAVEGSHVGNAAFDAMVVTSDPARISEFRIVAGTELDAVRADGVVVATPAGSHGYARSAGGPRLRPGGGGAAVVPVAAFTMTPNRWVVGLDAPVEIRNERDVPLSLLVDDERRDLRPDRPVTVTAAGVIDLVVPDSAE